MENKTQTVTEGAMEYQIGTQYSPVGKNYVCTVTDILKTYNSKGELVSVRYVATHEFCGQILESRDVCAVTIARGLIRQVA